MALILHCGFENWLCRRRWSIDWTWATIFQWLIIFRMLLPSENISTVATLQSWCLKMTLSISTKTFTFHKDKNSLWMTPKPSLQTLHISDPAARDKLDKKYIQVGVYTGRRPTVGQHLPVHISFWDKWLTELFFPETFDWRTFVHIVHTNLWLCHHWSRPVIIDFVVVFFTSFLPTPCWNMNCSPRPQPTNWTLPASLVSICSLLANFNM